MSKLTRRQFEILKFIIGFKLSQNNPPTYKEMGKSTGTSVPNVCQLMCKLRNKGFIQFKHASARSVEILLSDEECGILMRCQSAKLLPQNFGSELVPPVMLSGEISEG